MNPSIRRGAVAQLLLVVVAAALQFTALDAQSLWYDEGFSVWLARQPLSEIIARTASDIHPPLYYLLLHGWIRLAGESEWALRFPGALCAIVTVPLIWRVTHRLLLQESAALAASVLVAVSPLWLWYGRDARMYTLVVALLLGACLPLLYLLQTRRSGTRWADVACFGILSTAAVYTHFYAWFLLGGWALASIAWWAPRTGHHRARGIIAAFAVPLLAFLPWLGILLNRLGADRSYWAGTLPLSEVVTGALSSWMVGHTMLEAEAALFGWIGGALALAGLLVLGWRARDGGARRDALPPAHWLFLTIWLAAPVIGLLAISWNRPKFHERYLIFAAPAFFILLAGGLAWLWSRRPLGRWVAIVIGAFLLAVAILSDWNLYRDPAFAKDDWRGIAAFLGENRESSEPIVLVSGHSYPVFHYYYTSDENVYRLPDEPTLDTEVVVDVPMAAALASRIDGASRLWLINWQHEVADPEGIVPALARAVGGEELPLPGFMGIDLRAWDLPEQMALSDPLAIANPLDVRFGDALRLEGWTAPPEPSLADQGLGLTLYWSAARPLATDYKMRLSVVDEAGFEYGVLDERPTSYLYPTFRWKQGDTRLGALTIPLVPGTPAGEYWVMLAIYEAGSSRNLDILDEVGAPAGQQWRLGPLTVGPPRNGWSGSQPSTSAERLELALLDDQRLIAVESSLPEQWEPGQRVPVTFWWRTGGPLPGATLHLGWEQGETTAAQEAHPPAGEGWPGEQWREGDLLRIPVMARIPRELEPGPARLVGWLSDADGRESERFPIARGTVVERDHSFERPAVALPQAATFGDTIALLGYDLSSDEISQGQPITLTLDWQALAGSDQNLTRFVHLLDVNGTIIPGAGQDSIPMEGTRPTTTWVEGEYLREVISLRLPPDAPPAPYTIEVGWYDATDPAFPRLPASGEGADRDRVLLSVALR